MRERLVDILMVRMDRLGDLILSMPADEHPACRGQRVHWFITRGLSFVPEQAAPKRAATEFKRGFSVVEFVRAVRWLRKHRPRTVVLLHNPWWISMATWWAGVPERVGRLSQWHSFLFVNVPVRQKRSKADRHESDFNFDLIEWGSHRLGMRRTANLAGVKATYLRLSPPNPYATLEARGLKSGGYRVVHPGMAGSALNWPPESYVALIEELARDLPVLITGTKADQKYLVGVESVRDLPNVTWLVDELRPAELLDLLAEARAVVAPSTGIIHLAASLGTATIGIYSPRRVEHPRRWGPRGARATYLVPPVGEVEMINPDVMREISVADVTTELERIERDSKS